MYAYFEHSHSLILSFPSIRDDFFGGLGIEGIILRPPSDVDLEYSHSLCAVTHSSEENGLFISPVFYVASSLFKTIKLEFLI